jgi:hypothetical protein
MSYNIDYHVSHRGCIEKQRRAVVPKEAISPTAKSPPESAAVGAGAANSTKYPVILSEEQHTKSDKIVLMIKKELQRDLKFQKLMKEVNYVFKSKCAQKNNM